MAVLPLYFVERNFSYSHVGLFFALIAMIALVTRLVAVKYQQQIANPFFVLVLAIVPVVSFPMLASASTPVEVLFPLVMISVAGSMFTFGLQYLTGRVVPGNKLASAFAITGLGVHFGLILGLAISTWLAAKSFLLVFYLACLCSIVFVFTTVRSLVVKGARMRRERGRVKRHIDHAPKPIQSAFDKIQQSYSMARHHRIRLDGATGIAPSSRRNVGLVCVHLVLFQMALFMYPAFFPIMLLREGLAIQWVGPVIASSWLTFGASSLVGSAFVDLAGHHARLIAVSVTLAALLNLAMWASPLWLMITLWILLGVSDGLGRPVVNARLANAVSRRDVASAFAFSETSVGVARVFGPPCFAVVASMYGLRAGLLLAAFLMLISLAPISWIRTRDQPHNTEEPLDDAIQKTISTQ